jgi:hypothetical protein
MAKQTRHRRSEGERARDQVRLWQRRAQRPTVLRPWSSECLILKANDTRIRGRTVARCTGEAYALSGPGEWIDRDPGAAQEVEGFEAERLGLLGALEELRRGSWQGRERTTGDLAAVELVGIDADLVDSVCRWPVLPRKCTKNMAAERLGVNIATVTRWLIEGKLVARPARGKRHPSTRQYVSYPATSRLVQRQGGPTERHPDQARRMMCEEPDIDWVVSGFRREQRRQPVVRLARWVRTTRGRVDGRKHFWVCPVCRAEAYHLYLPAGPMARAGVTWSGWRFQCRCCAGVTSEAREWGRDGADALGQWALKLSCGQLSGNEFRRGMAEYLSGAWDGGDSLGLDSADGA